MLNNLYNQISNLKLTFAVRFCFIIVLVIRSYLTSPFVRHLFALCSEIGYLGYTLGPLIVHLISGPKVGN